MSETSDERNGSIDLDMNESTGIATLCMNNPMMRNAMTPQMMNQLDHVITELENWTTGKAVIIYGKNGFFSSGVDLNFVREHANSYDSGYQSSRLMQTNLYRLQSLPLLTVAAIDGKALGGGSEIATACDVRLMTRSAELGFVHIRVGVTTAWSGGVRLVKILGYTKALELLLSGRLLSAKEAFDLGFVCHLFDPQMNKSDEQLVYNTKQWFQQYFNNLDKEVVKEYKNSINMKYI